jgi:hypothetical protein
MQSTTAARRHRAVGGTAAEQELEAVASAVIWQSYGPIMCDSDRRDWDFDMERSEREAWDIGWSIRVPPPTRTAIFNESKTFLAAVA